MDTVEGRDQNVFGGCICAHGGAVRVLHVFSTHRPKYHCPKYMKATGVCTRYERHTVFYAHLGYYDHLGETKNLCPRDQHSVSDFLVL
jgi:hypothetical protein